MLGAKMLHVESPRRLLVVVFSLAVLAAVIYLLSSSSGTSTSGSSATSVAQQVLTATSAQPHVQLEQQARGTASTSLRLIDRTADENAFESGGVLLYLQKGTQLYTRGQNCYYMTTINASPPPLAFVQELLPPVGTKAVYSQPAPNELVWALPSQGKVKAKPTQGHVIFDPKTHLLQSASITAPQVTEHMSVTYPVTLDFPQAPTNICKALVPRKKK